jgi:hypothetical protein
MSNPGPSHVAAARRVLRYLAGTRSLGITYKRSGQDAAVTSVGGHVSSNTLTASADADIAGAKDRLNVSGWALMLNGAAVTWSSKRQPKRGVAKSGKSRWMVHWVVPRVARSLRVSWKTITFDLVEMVSRLFSQQV